MTATVPDVLGWLRTRAIADAAGDGAMFQEAATLLYDFKINAKALLVYCDSTGSGDAIYSLQCLRRLVERMESPNEKWHLRPHARAVELAPGSGGGQAIDQDAPRHC